MREGWLERPAVSRSTSPFSIGEMLQRLSFLSLYAVAQRRELELKKKKKKLKSILKKEKKKISSLQAKVCCHCLRSIDEREKLST